MSDCRDIGAVLERWDWDRLGYSDALPGRITPSDIDMIVERNARFLIMETKGYDGCGEPQVVKQGQWILLNRLARLNDFQVFVLWGNPSDDNPLLLLNVKTLTFSDWRDLEQKQRHDELWKLFVRWTAWAEQFSAPRVEPFPAFPDKQHALVS